MSEATAELVRRHFEDIFNRRILSVCDEIMAEEFVEHAAAPFAQSAPGRVRGSQSCATTLRPCCSWEFFVLQVGRLPNAMLCRAP
jgi:hypothetical protein